MNCKYCGREQESQYYVFCDSFCQSEYFNVIERASWYKGEIMESKEASETYKRELESCNIPKDVYIAWYEDRTPKVNEMSIEQTNQRIMELSKITFFARQEMRLLYENRDKKLGRKGIHPLVKDRDKLITDPDIKISWGEETPKRKFKQTKDDKLGIDLKDAIGLDLSELKKEFGRKKADDSIPKEVKVKSATTEAVPSNDNSILENVKALPSQKEIEDKAAALKARLLAAKGQSNGTNQS